MSRMPVAGRARTTFRRTALLGGAFLSIAILAGCSASGTLSASASSELRAGVVAVADAAAAGDNTAATTALAAVEKDLEEQLAAGSIDPDRGAAIQAAIDLVRADLTETETPTEAPVDPVVTPTPTPTPTPSVTEPAAPTQPGAGTPGNGNGNGNDKPGKPGKDKGKKDK